MLTAADRPVKVCRFINLGGIFYVARRFYKYQVRPQMLKDLENEQRQID